jgi:hypothetical protein
MVTGLDTDRQKTQKSTVLSLDSAYDFSGIAIPFYHLRVGWQSRKRFYHLLEERLFHRNTFVICELGGRVENAFTIYWRSGCRIQN